MPWPPAPTRPPHTSGRTVSTHCWACRSERAGLPRGDAGLEHVEHGVDEPAVVRRGAARVGGLARQVVLDPFPLLVREFVASTHVGPPWPNQTHRRDHSHELNVRST